MIKVIMALEQRQGLAVFIYESEDDLPEWTKPFERDTRDGIPHLYSPSAKGFWDFLWQENKGKVLNAYYKWETITIDKRK